MSPEIFDLSISQHDGLSIVRMSGELDLASSDRLSALLSDLSDQTVVVDLAELTFIDSSGIAALVAAKDRLRSAGRGTRPDPPAAERRSGTRDDRTRGVDQPVANRVVGARRRLNSPFPDPTQAPRSDRVGTGQVTIR